ncbi:hypothetical protein LCGC14_1393260 [marine sediment metagenome]|uniref:Uncharacterized protein n=1 Tax=marine sediment metagenome TaxID=412755 RepID=A0A0F9MES5_9ZZZZ
MSEDFYDLTQINSLEFKFDIAILERRIEDWLSENLEEGTDFIFGHTTYGTHACTVYVKFLNEESAVAFKLRWR